MRALERSELPRSLGLAGVAVGTLVYAWWATGLRPFSWPAYVAVGAAGVVAIVFGTRRRTSSRPGDRRVPGAWMWGVLGALLAGWELAAYLQKPRADHPTLSYLADQMLDGHPARAVAFLVWLVVGAGLAGR